MPSVVKTASISAEAWAGANSKSRLMQRAGYNPKNTLATVEVDLSITLTEYDAAVDTVDTVAGTATLSAQAWDVGQDKNRVAARLGLASSGVRPTALADGTVELRAPLDVRSWLITLATDAWDRGSITVGHNGVSAAPVDLTLFEYPRPAALAALLAGLSEVPDGIEEMSQGTWESDVIPYVWIDQSTEGLAAAAALLALLFGPEEVASGYDEVGERLQAAIREIPGFAAAAVVEVADYVGYLVMIPYNSELADIEIAASDVVLANLVTPVAVAVRTSGNASTKALSILAIVQEVGWAKWLSDVAELNVYECQNTWAPALFSQNQALMSACCTLSLG